MELLNTDTDSHHQRYLKSNQKERFNLFDFLKNVIVDSERGIRTPLSERIWFGPAKESGGWQIFNSLLSHKDMFEANS